MGQNNLLRSTEEKLCLDGSPKDNRGPSPYVKQPWKLHSAAAPLLSQRRRQAAFLFNCKRC